LQFWRFANFPCPVRTDFEVTAVRHGHLLDGFVRLIQMWAANSFGKFR
jgi:hypothetical protein